MAVSTTCTISIHLAIALDDVMRLMGATATGDAFKCAECGRTVRPHRGESPHFEHGAESERLAELRVGGRYLATSAASGLSLKKVAHE